MSEPHSQPKRHRPFRILLFIALVILGGWGIFTRMQAEAELRKKTDEQAIPSVAVIKAPPGPSEELVTLPANVQAWHEAPIYARTSGYLKNWITDIGAHVKAGDLLAEIETPEVDAQLHQAEADLVTAQANNELSQVTAKRWAALLKTNAVSKQDADDKFGDAAAKAALVASSQANLDRLHQMEDFKRVIAPFDGIITARNTDTGALINAGNGGGGQELFHIAETDKLRAYVQVPETYTQAVKPDMTPDLTFTEYPGRTFPATLVHSADALDPSTRTLLIELEVDNQKGELLPGSYGVAHLKLPAVPGAVYLPVSALLFRSAGLQVATVGKDGKAYLHNIAVGRDFGKEIEITAGIAPDESVINNPPDSILDGQDVRIVTPQGEGDKNP